MLWTLGTHTSPIFWPWEPRLVWSPTKEWLDGPVRVSLVSSRLPRALDTLPDLFRFVRSAVELAARDQQRVVVVDGTALAAIVGRAAEVWGPRLLRVTVAPAGQSMDDWRRQTQIDEQPAVPGRVVRLFVSPPLESDWSSDSNPIPVTDRLLAAFAHQLGVVHLRSGGHWDRLLAAVSEWQVDSGRPPPTIHVAACQDLVPQRMSSRLVARGARVWLPPDSGNRRQNPSTNEPVAHSPTAVPITNSAKRLENYLIHATRRCDGPWPGQTAAEYLDELLWEQPERDRSPLATLQRILAQQRIQASNRAIRGGIAVVCLAQIDLTALIQRRVWRRHRRRWDFEPFGIGLDRDWLIRRGARPVVYGDEQVWSALPDADRPFFQWHAPLDEGPHRPRGASIDWRVECEWRVVGSIDLADMSDDQAFAYVPDESSARRLRPHCRFPIRVVSD